MFGLSLSGTIHAHRKGSAVASARAFLGRSIRAALLTNSRGAKHMKPKWVRVTVTCLALMSVTAALAAPREIEELCFEQSQHVALPLRRGAWEAFMANCIANLTPTPTKKRKYRKY